MTGQTILRYEILDKLGQGGMGVVYKARDTRLDRFVALKFLPLHLGGDEEAKERFIQEAKAASALDHVNICTIHDIGETNEGRLFIAMTFYEGETLKKKLDRGALAVPEAIGYTLQIAEGLARAHEAGIIHRDVKPGNIMVTNRQQTKLLDFGLAKMANVKLTKTGSTLGTVAYMSPEQAQGEAVDHRTDIWSLGVVFYEMLAGRRPFQGDYEQAVLYAILNRDPEPITALRAGLPFALERIIGRALEKNPALRLPNMQSLIEELKALNLGETKAPQHKKSIVVLPFTNLSPDPDNEYFSDGLTEEIITDISSVRSLRVISRNSAMQLKGASKDTRTIGRELEVDYVLQGGVRKAGDTLRVTAQLIDATADTNIWSGKYSGTLRDVFTIQEELSRKIVESLQITLTSGEEQQIARRPFENVQALDLEINPGDPKKSGESTIENVHAWESYLRARHELWRPSAGGLDRALILIRNALSIVGENALLYATMGQVYFQQVHAGTASDPGQIEEASRCLNRALELDHDLPAAHALRASISYKAGDLQGVVHACKRALSIDLNNAEALFWLSTVYAHIGRNAEARPLAQKLVSIDPLTSVNHWARAWIEFTDGKFEEALIHSRRACELDPENFVSRWGHVVHLAGSGLTDEACDEIDRFFPQISELPWSRSFLPYKAALRGNRAEALRLIEPDVVDFMWDDEYCSWQMATMFSMVGELDESMKWLTHAALDRGFVNYPFLSRKDMMLKNLRADPRFALLMERVEKLWEGIEA
ncbi:MAG: protein kinase [Verrucomicrobiales bacterium]